MKTKSHNQLLNWNHKDKKIYVQRQLNPPSYNSKFLYQLKEENPDYVIIKKYEI
jgi:hypothetical protein